MKNGFRFDACRRITRTPMSLSTLVLYRPS